MVETKMRTLKGMPAASGIARGTICLYATDFEDNVPHYTISEHQVASEITRLQEAITNARKELEPVVENAKKIYDENTAAIFKAHLFILHDEGLTKKIIELIRSRTINAEHAVSDIFEEVMAQYEGKEEHFRELVHDFLDARNRILKAFNLETEKFKCPVGERQPVIVAAKRLTPSMVMSIEKEHALAFVTEEGGLTSHATILARALGVPIVFGISIENELCCGAQVIVDGSAGKVILNPDEKITAYYEKKIAQKEKRKKFCEVRFDLAAQTKAGERVKLKLNVSTPEERHLIEGLPHDGIGLLRTEFLFMSRSIPPTEDEQAEMYSRFLEASPKKPVTIRLLDISSDKLPTFFRLLPEMNLDLGLRGAITVEAFPDIYLTQVKALLRANKTGNLRLLYPMVSDLEDLLTFQTLLKKAAALLKKEGVAFRKKVKAGVMIETPGACMLLDEILKEVDFVNIGSNDLLQYTLAASRGNRYVEKRYHICHPALLKLIEKIVAAGNQWKKEVCLCGEIASFEEHYPLLLQAGVRSFSVAISKFADIKCELLHFQKLAHKNVLKDFYRLRSKLEIDKFFHKFV